MPVNIYQSTSIYCQQPVTADKSLETMGSNFTQRDLLQALSAVTADLGIEIVTGGWLPMLSKVVAGSRAHKGLPRCSQKSCCCQGA